MCSCVVGTAHSSFLSGCEQMPSSTVVSPRLSRSVVVRCVYGPGCSGPEKALAWPGLKAPMWVSSGSCPPFIILTTASSPAQTSLVSAAAVTRACQAKAWEKTPLVTELIGQQPAGWSGVRAVGRSRRLIQQVKTDK